MKATPTPRLEILQAAKAAVGVLGLGAFERVMTSVRTRYKR
jgi:hypothetical protein